MKTELREQAEMTAVIEEFSELTVVSGVSGHEKDIATLVKQKTAALPYRLHEDDAGRTTGGNQGNLIFVPDHFNSEYPSIAVLAHLDTARDTGSTTVQITDDRITSNGHTQLGADNRWGLALLLNMMRSPQPKDTDVNLIYVCTVCEETGMQGAKFLNLSPWKVWYGIVLDSSLRPGNYIERCSGMTLFEAEFEGRAGHSAVLPRTGISAIAMAAEALSGLPRLTQQHDIVSNVGRIDGGTAVNVVPEKCTIWGEIRANDTETINAAISTYESYFREVASRAGGKVVFRTQVDFAPYVFNPDNGLVQLVRKAMEDSELTPQGVSYSGGSDANALHEKGIPAVNLGIGAQKPHSNDEFILLDDINFCIILISNLLKEINKTRGREI